MNKKFMEKMALGFQISPNGILSMKCGYQMPFLGPTRHYNHFPTKNEFM
jgi:hypothetical protein